LRLVERGGPLSGAERLDERELVSRCNRGDEAAWTLLYRTYRERVYRITHWRRWGFAREEAEDVMQEVFLALVNSLRSFDFRSSLETYISQIATNRCISALRKQTAVRAGGQTSHRPLEEIEPVVGGAADRPDRELLQREQRDIALKGLGMLSLACQSILRFRFVDGLSYQEIATLLEIEEGTVASRLSRCLGELRQACERLSGLMGKKSLRLATTP
jgi:RNA polymerase sigma-70 factor (ECF subfamily)